VLPCLLLGLTALPLPAQEAASPADPDDTVRIELAGASRYAPVTLSARDLDILEIFLMLSRSRGLNIVAGDEVKGPVTLELHAVPFQEALRAVAAVKGFEITRRGDIWFVHKPEGGDPASSIMHESRSYRLDYASPEDLLPVIESMLSGSGSAMAYLPLRAVVVEDRPSVLDRVGAILEALDQPRRQVLIEAQIIEA
jgi:type IV pilus assembly protein PilQ